MERYCPTENYIPMQNTDKEKAITKPKSLISGWVLLLLVAMYTIAYNNTFRAVSLLWYGISAAAILVLAALIFFNRIKGKMSFFVGWATAFFLFCILSCLWSMETEPAFASLRTLFLIFVVHILLAELIIDKKDLDKILFANFLALLFVALYILFTMDLSQIGEDRIGVDTLNEYWNANDIGMKMCVGLGFSLYFAIKNKSKWKRLFYGVCTTLFIILGLFTGSRKALLMIMFLVVLVFWLKAKRHRFLVLLSALAAAIGLYFLTINIESLYNVLGYRMEQMIEGLFKGETEDGSFNHRQTMIELGWKWFCDKPLLGYGLSNFRILHKGTFGFETYSHNNFIEILVSGGVVGFAIYYSIYVYIFVKLWRLVFKEKDLTAIILFSLNICTLVLQIALVSFATTLFNVLLMLGVVYVKLNRRKS